MKKILGSFLFIVIFMTPLSYAKYSWSVQVEKNNYYEKEAFLVTFLCQFDDRSPGIFIEFNPKARGFSFEKLDFYNKIIDGKRQSQYRYFVKANRAGKQTISVQALMRETTDESIKETVLGRDNDQDIVFDDTKVQIEKVHLTILPVPKKTEMIGSFVIESTFSKNHLKAFEPLQVKVKISGKGDFNALKPFVFSLEKGKVFTQKSEKKYTLTEKGYEGYVIWRYAMTSSEAFILPAHEIHYFDTHSKSLKTLRFEERSFTVDPKGSSDALLDGIEFPAKKKPFNWELLLNNSIYFLLGAFFVLLVAQIKRFLKRVKKVEKRFESLNDILSYLIESGKHGELLNEIEKDMKQKKLKSFSTYLGKLPKA